MPNNVHEVARHSSNVDSMTPMQLCTNATAFGDEYCSYSRKT